MAELLHSCGSELRLVFVFVMGRLAACSRYVLFDFSRGSGVSYLHQSLATQGSRGCSNAGWCQILSVAVKGAVSRGCRCAHNLSKNTDAQAAGC